jgi:hypothetical protein
MSKILRNLLSVLAMQAEAEGFSHFLGAPRVLLSYDHGGRSGPPDVMLASGMFA